MKKLLSLLLLAGLSGPAFGAPAVSVTEAWFRSLPGGLPAGGYFTAHNNGTRDLAITGAKSNGCGMLMLHQSQDMGGRSSMSMMDKVALPAGGSVAFTPG